MLVPVTSLLITIAMAVVILIPGATARTSVLSAIDSFPSINAEQAMPREVPLPAQTRVLVPLTERPVSLEPVRHPVAPPDVVVVLVVDRLV